MKGEVLHYDDNLGTGQISGADGIRYSFTRADLKQLVPISRGSRVDFDFEGKIAKDIYLDAPGGVVHGAAASAAPAYAASAAAAPAYAAAAAAPAEPNLSLWGYYIRAYTKKFASFTGRARRKEYWAVALFFVLVAILCFAIVFVGLVGRRVYGSSPETAFMETAITSPISVAGLVLLGIYAVASILPFAGLLFRRVHDIGWSGWVAAVLIALNVVGALVPVFAMVSSVLLLIVALIPGQAGENKYGPSPK